MKRYSLNEEERKITQYIDTLKIEKWAKQEQYWRIYREVIGATKKHLRFQKKG